MTENEAKEYQISKNFTLHEFLWSEKALELGTLQEQFCICPKEILNLKRLCDNVLQPLRDRLKKAVIISSGFRTLGLNTEIGGSENSEHMEGRAADIVCGDMARAWVILQQLDFRQLIKYGNYRFIHVSYNIFDNKKEIIHFAE
jgi:zinc D-Ala-D-Ala carboxypeptidase